MSKLILVRHGETNWNVEGRYQGQENTDLSPRGLEQGKLVGEALKDMPVDVYISSPLKRSFMTAEFCANHQGKEVIADGRLTEINHGVWEGQLSTDISAEYPDMFHQWHTEPHLVQMPGEGGESLEDVRKRVREAFDEYVDTYDGKTVLVAAHDAVNKAIICDVLGLGMEHFWQIKQDNTCVNVLECDKGVWRLVLMNYTGHLGYVFSGIEQKGL